MVALRRQTTSPRFVANGFRCPSLMVLRPDLGLCSHALVGSSRLFKIAHLQVTPLDPAKMVPLTELGPMTVREGDA